MIINHQVGIAGSATDIYEALTTNEGLMDWWTHDVTGAGEVGSVIQFRFNGGGPDFQVTELIPDQKVVWRHHGDMPEAWKGTEVSFDLIPRDNQVMVRFRHANWEEATDFMAHCTTKWAVFLLSLKALIETGTGQPFPDDIHIDHS